MRVTVDGDGDGDCKLDQRVFSFSRLKTHTHAVLSRTHSSLFSNHRAARADAILGGELVAAADEALVAHDLREHAARAEARVATIVAAAADTRGRDAVALADVHTEGASD